MNNIQCNKCGKWFALAGSLCGVAEADDLTVQYFSCPACGGEVNSWDKRCSWALGYQQIVCEDCIAAEYQIEVEELRDTMKEHFGLIPCPGI